jgi:hypothetical protein
MANSFKSIQATVGATEATAYTAPTGAQVVIIGMRIGNNLASDISVAAYLGRGATKTNLVGEGTPIPAGSALEGVMGSKVVMQAGDTFSIKGSAANCAELTLSVLEMT